MAHLDISGVKYPIPEEFTYGELSLIKRVAGVRVKELGAALEAGDTDVIVALAMIVLKRAGIDANESKLMALKAGEISSGDDEEEVETASPPAGAAEAAATNDLTPKTILPATPEASGVQAS